MADNILPAFHTIDVTELLPQQPPFVMVDALLSYDERTTSCRLLVRDDNLFCDGGLLSASGLIENVAQTCAARLGFINKYILKCGVQVGYIGAIRNFTIHRQPRVGEVLVTTIHVEENVMGMTLATARIEVGGECMAETEIKIALAQ